MSSAKERHYHQLSLKLGTLTKEVSTTQKNVAQLASAMQSMNKLGAMQAAQFMAVSRLLDKEMLDAEEAARAAEGTDDAEEK